MNYLKTVRKSWRRPAACALTVGSVVLSTWLTSAPVMATPRPNALDPNFGDHGIVLTPLDASGYFPEVKIQAAAGPAGTIVLGSGKTIARYLPDGTLDPAFGSGGMLTVADPEGLSFSMNDLAVDSAGRVDVFGEVEVPGVSLPASYVSTLTPTLAAIVRYDSSGAIDTSFGGGDGVVLTDFGQPRYGSPYSPPGYYEKAVAGAARGTVGTDGSLTVLGTITDIRPGPIRSAAASAESLVARLTPSGDFDPSFGGGDGVVAETGFRDIDGFMTGRAGHSILAGEAAGSPSAGSQTTELIARLEADGAIDQTFAKSGFRTLPLSGPVSAIAVDRRDRPVMLIGSSIVRLTPAGKLDRGFGRAGIAVVPSTAQVDLDALCLTRKGPVLVGSRLRPKARPYAGDIYRRSITLTRIGPSGKPNLSFGHRGWITTSLGGASTSIGREAFIDRRGRLLVAGAVGQSSHLADPAKILLARYVLR